jgi:dolichol-phosphate mannosyltransferase
MRAAISRFSTLLSKLIIPQSLKDPMSGFFMMRRELLHDALPRLSSIGFKILVDPFASVGRPLSFKELPYEFRPRLHGESKLDSLVAWEYLMLILDKTVGHLVPVRFLSFSIVGGIGVVVHMLTLWLLFTLSLLSFAVAQGGATVVAMTSNFLLNNVLTYRDARLRGWRLLTGWVSFCAACGIGAVSNVSVASFLYQHNHDRWVVAALGGILIGTVWNYVVTSTYTWKK